MPSVAARAGSASSSSTSRAASAAAQASGLPRNVLVCRASPVDSPQTDISDAEATQAEIGRPPPIALPTQRMSGVTPSNWQANQSPVRPQPVKISSKISSVSGFSANLAQAAQPAGGRNDDAAASLNRFGQNRARLMGCEMRPHLLQRAAVG